MTKNDFYSIVLLAVILLQSSCVCDCRENGDYIKLKLLKDGHNALFGPDASINRDSIRLFVFDISVDNYISFNDSSKTLDLFIGDSQEFVLKLGDFRTDTIIGQTVVVSTGACGCSDYKFSKVTFNGQIICQDGCNEIVDIQL